MRMEPSSSSSFRHGTAGNGAVTAVVTPVHSNVHSNEPESTSANQRATKRSQNLSQGEQPDGHEYKRRRRAFSCLSCQKLKCRCEYEPGSGGCHRCQTLRIECSLAAEHSKISLLSGPSAMQNGPSIEERLQRYEDALKDIQMTIADLKAHGQQHSHLLRNADTPYVDEGKRNERDERCSKQAPISMPADSGTKSAPVVVLREINAQVSKGYRRLLQHANLDLVELGMLDERAAKELIRMFSHYQGHDLIVCDAEDLTRRGDQHKESAFLHSVCCLHGIAYRQDLYGTPMHRQIYEEVRMTLGQALLSSPLTLAEINAVFLMSNNANTPSKQGDEYIDSWLLTGYCAKQAMLSISFSKIMNRVNSHTATVEDQRAMRLFSLICHHHLQWAATTGRPSIIPAAYINQCNILHSFRDATMQDGMLIAETALYSELHQKLNRHAYPGDGGECDDFTSWRQKWDYLWGLPTSSTLRMGYHAACLILDLRCLEENGGTLRPQVFLSDEDADTRSDDGQPETHPGVGKHSEGVEKENAMRAHACKHAKLMLETFLEMPPALADSVTTCMCLCIAYCALVLAYYEESQSRVSDQASLDLITRVENWARHAPGKAWSFKYGELAKRKVEARINKAKGTDNSDGKRSNGAGQPTRDHAAFQEHLTRPEIISGDNLEQSHLGSGDAGIGGFDAGEWASPGQSFDSATVTPGFEQNPFPSLEYFFGGGFYDFTR